jgi:SRSO17 transposase
VDVETLRALRPALVRFCGQFRRCIKTRESRRHLRTYMEGQLGPLERKSVEPMALEAGVPPRTLQEFLSLHHWAEEKVRRRLWTLIQRDHADEDAIAVVDETSFPKKGDKTPGVQRQYCGAMGKQDNCVVTVHLAYVSGDFHGLVDGDLYLPESWAKDRERCREAGIPEEVGYRPKWQIALDILDRTMEGGVHFRWLTADEGYGRSAEYREGVAARGLLYVVEVPVTERGWTRCPRMEEPDTHRTGPTPKTPRVALGEPSPREVRSLWKRGGPAWKTYRVKDTGKGPVVWEVRESAFWPARDGVPGERVRLLVAREVFTGEVKYFLTNAPDEVDLATVLCVAFSRWHVERLFEDGKGEVGLDHFEGRRYRGLQRHLVLSMLSWYFLAEQTDLLRRRGGKPGLDGVPGAGGAGGATTPGTASAGEDPTAGGRGREDPVLAAAHKAGRLLPRDPPAAQAARDRNRSPSGHPMPAAAIAL